MLSICPDDTKEQNHCLFEDYKDPCRAGPGKEKPWVIGVCSFIVFSFSKRCLETRIMTLQYKLFVFKGTLLEQPTLYEDDINTPENLQRYKPFSLSSLASLLM